MNITASFNAKDYIPNYVKAAKIKFALQYRNVYIWVICVAVASIILLATGIPDDFIISGLGVGFAYVSIFYTYTFLKARNKSLKKNSNADSIQNNIGQVTISFNNDIFVYTDIKCHYEIKWSFFVGYLIRDEFLFLINSSGVLQAFAINTDLFEKADFDELKDFLSANVPLFKK